MNDIVISHMYEYDRFGPNSPSATLHCVNTTARQREPQCCCELADATFLSAELSTHDNGKKKMFWVSLSIFVFFHLTLLSKSSYQSLVIVQHEKRDFYFLVTDKNSLFNVDQWFLTFPLLVFFRECECQIRSLRTHESILLFYYIEHQRLWRSPQPTIGKVFILWFVVLGEKISITWKI